MTLFHARISASAVLLSSIVAGALVLLSVAGSADSHGLVLTPRQRGALNSGNYPTIDANAPIDYWCVGLCS